MRVEGRRELLQRGATRLVEVDDGLCRVRRRDELDERAAAVCAASIAEVEAARASQLVAHQRGECAHTKRIRYGGKSHRE